MNSIILLPLFVAAATAASLYPRNHASAYQVDYPFDYPANYPVGTQFNYGAETRQGVPLPTLLTQQAVLALANWQVRNTVAFWNMMNCLVDASCPTVSTEPAPVATPTRLQTLFQQMFSNLNTVQADQPNVFQTLSEQLGSLFPFASLTPQEAFRQIPAVPVQQYPGYFADQFE